MSLPTVVIILDQLLSFWQNIFADLGRNQIHSPPRRAGCQRFLRGLRAQHDFLALVVIEKVKRFEQVNGRGEEGELFLEWLELGVSLHEAVTRGQESLLKEENMCC